MHLCTWPTVPLTLLAMLAAQGSSALSQADDLQALSGEWLYVEDRTEGRPYEKQQPPMSVTFALRIEEDAFVMVRGKGASRREQRVALDGSITEVDESSSVALYRGEWKDGSFEFETEIVRKSDGVRTTLIRREFRATPDGLLVRVVVGEPAQLDSLALYRHPEDIEVPEPARAEMADMSWLAGAWVGARGGRSIEERWSPPLGGAMLGVSRTVSRGSMVAFEYLRIVERGSGLVYVAQPGGRPPTEFVLVDLNETFAVFENPRHDSPQRIEYELHDDGVLTASIGFINGGSPQVFEFQREGD